MTRIKASDSSTVTASPTSRKKTAVPKTAAAKSSDTPKKRNPFAAFIGYFVGAWQELRQVRWPDRRATWSLTFAVLAFSAFFVVFILLLDAGFKLLFELLLK